MSANYWASTQCNNWLLDRPQLELARKEDLRYATRLQCAAIGVFFSNLISTIAKRLNLRQRVVASACVFFHRFFSKNSYSALDPFLVCATCVYVAAKVQESPIHIKLAVAEATRCFQEVGYRGLPTDNSSLAQMEFYLLEEMEFDLILFHPYRSLVAMYDKFGKPKHGSNASASGGSSALTGLGLDAGDFGVIKGLTSVEERDAMGDLTAAARSANAVVAGDAPRLAELDENVLQMAWFVVNDSYKTALTLVYPPYMVALAAMYLALALHAPAFDKVNASLTASQNLRSQHAQTIANILNNPDSCSTDLTKALETLQHSDSHPPHPHTCSSTATASQPHVQSQTTQTDALSFFATLNVSLPLLAEVVQQMVGAYHMQNQVAGLVGDGVRMVKLLESMRESRRLELLQTARENAAQR